MRAACDYEQAAYAMKVFSGSSSSSAPSKDVGKGSSTAGKEKQEVIEFEFLDDKLLEELSACYTAEDAACAYDRAAYAARDHLADLNFPNEYQSQNLGSLPSHSSSLQFLPGSSSSSSPSEDAGKGSSSTAGQEKQEIIWVPVEALHESKGLATGHMNSESLNSKLIGLYAGCGDVKSAKLVFERIQKPTVFAWNWMISASAFQGNCEDAIKYFSVMEE
ncbi:hypothetical protein HHK36_022554 [Tetracentron sinense]|uniref:Pentatricopeptide repeat-containing protein n=1 Tax=Tetracentron sinense TaxID=13715 RepID=A0A834YV16_TETSI|nr:hypothetical protein HHK36_022554 [Tetracentron sinense]